MATPGRRRSGRGGVFPISLAVDAGLTVDQIAHAFTVYPPLTGSVAEAARLLHLPPG